MKPIFYFPLSLLLIAALVGIMYTQSGNKEGADKTTSEEVAGDTTSSEETADEESADEETASEEAAPRLEEAEIDEVVTDEPEAPVAEPKKATKLANEENVREQHRITFRKMDISPKDGLATEQEHIAFYQKVFSGHDKNNDGRMTPQEIGKKQLILRLADKDKDGALTLQEYMNQFALFFEVLDKDKSGDLTEEEFVR